jgi:hypothetical protein
MNGTVFELFKENITLFPLKFPCAITNNASDDEALPSKTIIVGFDALLTM